MKNKLVRIIALIVMLAIIIVAAFWINRILEKHTYKLLYVEQIKANAEACGLDPFFVAAVIYCESGYDKDAVSPVGAVGLMQIMPDTGAWIAEKLEMEGYCDQQLHDPETNIKMGCWYLQYLTERFGGIRKHVLAAYNAGPNNVSKWLMDAAYSTEGNLTQIPFEETRNFVERVMRAYEKYRELYEKELA